MIAVLLLVEVVVVVLPLLAAVVVEIILKTLSLMQRQWNSAADLETCCCGHMFCSLALFAGTFFSERTGHFFNGCGSQRAVENCSEALLPSPSQWGAHFLSCRRDWHPTLETGRVFSLESGELSWWKKEKEKKEEMLKINLPFVCICFSVFFDAKAKQGLQRQTDWDELFTELQFCQDLRWL